MEELEIVEGLNEGQAQAVLNVEGAYQINAVAGSGKTTVLVARIKHMINNLKIPASNILVTTFTKKASEEMISRLENSIGKQKMIGLTIGTMHSICYKLLKKEYTRSNNPMRRAFNQEMLVGNTQKIAVDKCISLVLKDFTVQYAVKECLRELPPKVILSLISNFKNSEEDNIRRYLKKETSLPGYAVEGIYYVYEEYEAYKRENYVLDMDDLLSNFYDLLNTNKEVLERYQKIYRYILVDESQDNNYLQYQIVKKLAYPENNIFFVGDDSQCIYSFRGSRPDQFINLKSSYLGCKSINIDINYRSDSRIVDAANNLIENNKFRVDKKTKANRHFPNIKNPIVIDDFENDKLQGEELSIEINRLVNELGYKYSDICVLYRANSCSITLEEMLLRNQIPYKLLGSISFFERKEIKDILAYLKLVVDESDGVAFSRVYNVPTRYIGKAFLGKVKTKAEEEGKSCIEILRNFHLNFRPQEEKGAKALLELIDKLRDVYNKEGVGKTIEYLMKEGGYEDYLIKDDEDEEDNSKVGNVETFKTSISSFSSIHAVLKYIDILIAQASTLDDSDSVKCMTIHKSKGLEFPVVFMISACENIIPHRKILSNPNQDMIPKGIEEERRLMYVAITRAEQRFYCYSYKYDSMNSFYPSRFIREMRVDVI